MDKNSKIFVAGHMGLVGNAIVNILKKDGFTNIITAKKSELNLINQIDVENFFNKEKPEYVFLCAAKVGGIVANNTYRANFIYENLCIQNNIIHQSFKNKVKKLLFLGSTCIYPKHCPQPMQENALLTGELEYTNEPYAIAKIAGLKMCESYNIQYGTNFLGVMPTNLYGENDNFDLINSHVLPAMIRKFHLAKLLENNNFSEVAKNLNIDINDVEKTLLSYGISKNEISIWGSGNPRREFLHVNDMAKACLYIMKNLSFNDLKNEEEIRNTHLNIGTGSDISIKELAYLIKKIIGFNGIVSFDTSKPDGTMLKKTDPSKLEKLGWSAEIQLEDGIKSVYEWYQQKLKS